MLPLLAASPAVPPSPPAVPPSLPPSPPPAFTGYLADKLCWNRTGHISLNGTNLETDADQYTTACLLQPSCIASGYYLTQLSSGVFSPRFALDQTGVDEAVALLTALDSHASSPGPIRVEGDEGDEGDEGVPLLVVRAGSVALSADSPPAPPNMTMYADGRGCPNPEASIYNVPHPDGGCCLGEVVEWCAEHYAEGFVCEANACGSTDCCLPDPCPPGISTVLDADCPKDALFGLLVSGVILVGFAAALVGMRVHTLWQNAREREQAAAKKKKSNARV